MGTDIETRSFRLVHPQEADRVVRGKVDLPKRRGAAGGRLPHVIVLHGFKGFMDWGFFPDIAVRVAARGFGVVRFNVSGSGVGDDLESFTEPEAFARNTIGRELEDLSRVRSWIASGEAGDLDPERASLVGHSRGGGVALLHAAESQDLRCVVTWSSVATFDRFDEATKALWREKGSLSILNARTGQSLPLDVSVLEDLERHGDRYDLVRACGRIRRPVLLVHGTEDESVPFHEAQALLAALGPGSARLEPVAGAGHTFGIRHPMTGSTSSWEQVVEATLEALLDRG